MYDLLQRDDFQPSLVMELVEGGSVADWMRSGTITLKQAAFIVREAAIGLAQAHEAKLIHRDVKPSNLLLETDEGEITRVCVADFGLVAVVDADSDLTRTGEIAGTPAYMSPEQIDAPSQVGYASDVYSLGCVLYQLLTGAVPFDGTVRMVLWQVLHEEPLPPSRFDDRIPKSLEAVCLKAMHRDPEHRYASAQAMADDLDRFLDGSEVDARLPSAAHRAWRQAKRHPTATFGIAVSLLSIFAVAVVSSLYAWRLADANHQTQVQATRADRGKEIALEVMESIVFDAYDELDATYFDPDELQIQLLRAAAEGLSRIENDTGPTLFKRAETHARLGRALWRVSQLEEAQEQLLQATKAIDRMTVQQRDSIPCIRLQLRVGLDSAATSDELGCPDEAIRALAPMLRLADILAERKDATVESLRAAARVHQYYSYSVDGLEEEAACRNALSIHQKCGELLQLDDVDTMLRLQLERELGESLYFQNKLPEALASWRTFLESAKAVREVYDSRGFEFDGSVLSEWFHANAGLAACEIELGRRQKALGRLEDAWTHFEKATQADIHIIEVSQGIWQLIDTALEDELVVDAAWELQWLRRASDLIDQEADFIDDESLREAQIQWKRDLLQSLKRNEATEEAAVIEQQLKQLQHKESEAE
ncbi:MAG: serine/threonine-protein kinase [Planctomycetota bacterium]